jgi:MFS transporter, DHA1 family, multidrug resistance protein
MSKITKDSPFFIIFLAMLGALPPFAIDTYLPAVPQIAHYFHVSTNTITLTITTYFIGFSFGMLIWGLISDRFGRKNTLLLGILCYIISTLACTITHSFLTFKVMRFFQGFSDSSGAIISISIARDCFNGVKLKRILSSIIMIMMTAPIVAPVIGSSLIYLTSEWKNIFHFLTLYGLILLIAITLLEETLTIKNRSQNILSGLKLYFLHLTNYRLIIYSIISGLCFSAIFSFIGSSSLIFIISLSLSYTSYCTLFAINILGIILANFVLKNKLLNTSLEKITIIGMSSCFIGIFVCILSYNYINNAYLFALGLPIITFGFALTSTTIQSQSLNSVSYGFGAASAISSSIKFILAGISNYYMSFFAYNKVVNHLSIQQLVIAIIVIISIFLMRKRLYKN